MTNYKMTFRFVTRIIFWKDECEAFWPSKRWGLCRSLVTALTPLSGKSRWKLEEQTISEETLCRPHDRSPWQIKASNSFTRSPSLSAAATSFGNQPREIRTRYGAGARVGEIVARTSTTGAHRFAKRASNYRRHRRVIRALMSGGSGLLAARTKRRSATRRRERERERFFFPCLWRERGRHDEGIATSRTEPDEAEEV